MIVPSQEQIPRAWPPALIVEPPELPPAPLPPLNPIERKPFDYSELEAATPLPTR
jgi:hypothetical protein